MLINFPSLLENYCFKFNFIYYHLFCFETLIYYIPCKFSIKFMFELYIYDPKTELGSKTVSKPIKIN